jgi:hypothetical protein
MHVRQTKWFNWKLAGAAVAMVSGFFLLFALNFHNAGYVPVEVALALAGITLCLVGMRLLLEGTYEMSPVEVNDTELGHLQLNGYSLVAYECETPDGGKQFRLATEAALTAQQEAALIRYLALEGFLVTLWPDMKDRIEQEAGWAFLV